MLLSYRLRGNPPAHDTFGGKVRYLIYQVKIIMQAFYPPMLNTAKRSRTHGGGPGAAGLPLRGGEQVGKEDQAGRPEGHL